ncbi:MAG TPA: septum formation initiator family protein [Rhizomicrobium sp.]|nr:septum formation initiator family protein [Rhizomicrobium sp.]
MRIRRSVSRFFSASVIPAICAAATLYFGYYAIWGSRGVVELGRVNGKLAVQKERLAQIKDQRIRLQHRISLLEPGSVDPDMVEELARGQLHDGGPNQVAVPRDAR